MKLLILAAGYATRLYPLTKNKAKPLLDIAGRPMIEHVLATAHGVRSINEIFIVTNEKFARDFEAWAKDYRRRRRDCPPIAVVNDRSTDDSNKLGAIGDVRLVLNTHNVDDDLLIIGGDNLFKQPLDDFVAFAAAHGPTLGVYDVGDLEQMKKYGSVIVDGREKIVEFEEKPSRPKTTLAAMCLYYYPRAVLPLIEQYVKEGNNPDQPGRLIAWMHTRRDVFAHQIHGQWLDIGSFETLEQANREFA